MARLICDLRCVSHSGCAATVAAAVHHGPGASPGGLAELAAVARCPDDAPPLHRLSAALAGLYSKKS